MEGLDIIQKKTKRQKEAAFVRQNFSRLWGKSLRVLKGMDECLKEVKMSEKVTVRYECCRYVRQTASETEAESGGGSEPINKECITKIERRTKL